MTNEKIIDYLRSIEKECLEIKFYSKSDIQELMLFLLAERNRQNVKIEKVMVCDNDKLLGEYIDLKD